LRRRRAGAAEVDDFAGATRYGMRAGPRVRLGRSLRIEIMLACNRAYLLPALVAPALLGLAAAASAQQPNAPAPAPAQQSAPQVTGSGWRVDCNNNGKALDCRAYSEAVQGEKRQIISSLSVRYAAEVKKSLIIVQVPLGILVSEPVSVGVDGDAGERIVIETCTPAGCFAGSAVPDALIAKMRTGKEVKIVFANMNRQPLTVTMPLAGFAVAYDKIKG
jgi:invasion protein IalB